MTRTPPAVAVAILILAVFAAAPAAAAGVVGVEVTGNTVRARVELEPALRADLELVFEQALGLSIDSLGLSAEVVDPLAADLLSRLPDPGAMGIPSAFPVLLRIEPPASGPLSFTGLAALNLHTHALSYAAGSSLRLFSAPAGGGFHDVTETAGMGSYRVRGTKGGFSEFLIVSDLRSSDPVIQGKFAALQDLLDEHAPVMSAQSVAELQADLDAAQASYAAGQALYAAQEIDAFIDRVRVLSGTEIPDVWRSARDLPNAAGELRAAAGTLRFSLNLLASGAL